jgi:hypothetical protein
MDKISTIKQNILYFAESQGFKKEDFFNKIEISYSNFKGKSLFSEIGADKLVKILTNYPQINADWLLTGKGEMLRNIEEDETENPMAVELLEYKNKEIAELKKQLQECEDEKKIRTDSKINV